MKVFLSFSRDLSHKIAAVLYAWLLSVMQDIRPASVVRQARFCGVPRSHSEQAGSCICMQEPRVTGRVSACPRSEV
jgi:hypothetical protein